MGILFFADPKTADVSTSGGCGRNFCNPRFFSTIEDSKNNLKSKIAFNKPVHTGRQVGLHYQF